MRSDSTCDQCGAPTRIAHHAAGNGKILLDPSADINGRYAVIAWEHTIDAARSIPIVAANPTKTAMPTRYRKHTCR